jgi:O-antigen/teichoic acid export membrane protein
MAVGLGGKALELVTLVPLLTVVPRVLGPGDYGALALALSIVMIGSTAAALGGPTLMSRFVPATPSEERAELALTLTIRSARWRFALVGIAAVGAGAVAAVAPQTLRPLPAALVVAALAFDIAATLMLQAALALGHIGAWSVRYPIQNAVLVASVLPLHAIWGTDGALVALPLSTVAAFAFGFAVLAPRLRGVSPTGTVSPQLVRFAAVQGAGGALTMITQRGGIVAVALLGGSTAQQGYAGISIGIALAATYGVWQLFTVELPGLSVTAAADLGAAEASVRRTTRILAFPAGAGALAGALVAGPLLAVVAGRAYRESAAALGIALAAVALAPATGALNQLAALRLQPESRLFATAAGAAAFIAAALVLVPAHDAAGASGALVVGTATMVLVAGAILRPALDALLVTGSLASSAAVVILAVTR